MTGKTPASAADEEVRGAATVVLYTYVDRNDDIDVTAKRAAKVMSRDGAGPRRVRQEPRRLGVPPASVASLADLKRSR